MRNAVILTSLLGVAVLTGCPDRTISEVSPEQGRVEYKDIPVNVSRKVDILFVIDDSPSMLDKQTNLKANFPNFINVLNTIQGGLPDVHIGVVTSDLGTSGADGMNAPSIGGSAQGGCSGTGKGGALQTYGTTLVTGKYISDAPPTVMGGMRMTNYTGPLAAAFSAIASAGANGCGFEQHIEAAKRALQPSNTANAGFLRSDAFLAVIIIADEDDCSMQHSTLLATDTSQLGPLQSFRCTRYGITCDTGGSTPDAMNQVGPKSACHSNESGQYLTKIADYVTFFKGLKPDDNSKVIMAAISGVTTPVETELRAPSGSTTAIPALAHSCTYTDPSNSPEVADPAIRIHELLDGFPNRSTFSTICQQDLSGGLTLIAQLLKTALGSPCIDGTLAMPYDCSVSDVQNYGKANQVETILPECNNTSAPASSTNEPCWAIETDPQCSSASHLTLKIERGSTATPPDGTHTISYCVTVAGGSGG
jgi:hypothetical protein